MRPPTAQDERDERDCRAVPPAQRSLPREQPLRAHTAGRRERLTDDGDFAEILPAARAGGEWALAILYRRHHPAVVRYLRAKSGQDAEDIASQTWLDVARNLSSFRGDEDAFRGWVFTIARRRLVDHGRRRSRRPEAPTADTGDDSVGSERDPAELAVEAMTGDAAARRIVDLLPASQAEVVLLRVVAGLDVAAVAEITGKRPGTVRVLQHRALQRLAARLGEDLEGCNAAAPPCDVVE